MLPTKFHIIWPSGFRGKAVLEIDLLETCLWQPYLLIDRDEMSNLYRGPPLMHPTKFRFIWPSGFREDFQKSTNQKQELPVAAMFVNGSGRNE